MSDVRKRTVRWTSKDGEPLERVAWEATFWDRRGKRHRSLHKRKTDAEAWHRKQVGADENGTHSPPSNGKVTLAKYVEGWRGRQVHRETTSATFATVLDRHILPALGGIKIAQISTDDVKDLVASWNRSAAPATVHQRYTILSIVMRAAVESRAITKSPCSGISLPDLPAKSSLVPITTDVVLALADEIIDPYKAIVLTGAGTGMRRGELLGLTLDRVSTSFRSIKVDRQLSRASGAGPTLVPPKTPASNRTIPVAQVVIDTIVEHVEEFGVHDSGLVFQSLHGDWIRASTFAAQWRVAAKKVGTDATPHDLRHYFASVQLRAGQSIKALQLLLGHKTAMETLDTYSHLMGDEDDRSRAAIEVALGERGLNLGATKVPQRAPVETA